MPNTEIKARIERTTHLMLDKIDQVLDVLKRQYDPPLHLAPLEAGVWRWTNNRLDVQKFCVRPACRRARSASPNPSTSPR